MRYGPLSMAPIPMITLGPIKTVGMEEFTRIIETKINPNAKRIYNNYPNPRKRRYWKGAGMTAGRNRKRIQTMKI